MGRRRNLEGLRVLITGASQGIGRALAIAAANRGMRVLAAARSQELLDIEKWKSEEVASGQQEDQASRASRLRAGNFSTDNWQLFSVVADVTNPEDRQRMADAAKERFGGLDVLINNAGIGATGHFMDSDPDILRKIFEVNLFGTTETTRACLPLLKEGTTPAIVNISSVVARRALPARSLYSSSKAAVQGWSEALRAELDKDGVDVIVINPGLTKTNFSQNMLEAKARMQMDHLRGMTSEQVAERTLDALARGKHEVTFTRQGRLLLFAARFFPFVVDFFARKKVRELFADEIAERKAKSQTQQQDQAATPQ